MARQAYIGTGVARKIRRGYIGVEGVARRIKRAYVGVNGVARPCWGVGLMMYGNIGTITSGVYGCSSQIRYLLNNSIVGVTFADKAIFARNNVADAVYYDDNLTQGTISNLIVVHDDDTNMLSTLYKFNEENLLFYDNYKTKLYKYDENLVRTSVGSLSGGSFVAQNGEYVLYCNESTGAVSAYDSNLVKTSADKRATSGNTAMGTGRVGKYAVFHDGEGVASTDLYDDNLVHTTLSTLDCMYWPVTVELDGYLFFYGDDDANYDESGGIDANLVSISAPSILHANGKPALEYATARVEDSFAFIGGHYDYMSGSTTKHQYMLNAIILKPDLTTQITDDVIVNSGDSLATAVLKGKIFVVGGGNLLIKKAYVDLIEY